MQGQGSSDPAQGAHEAFDSRLVEAGSCEIVMDGMAPLYAEILPVHAALLPIGPAGKVLYFSGSDYNFGNRHQFDDMADQRGIDHTRVWDVANNSIALVSPAPSHHDLFCCGHAFLEDGRLLAAGGTERYVNDADTAAAGHPHHWPGLRNASIFTPDFSGRSPGSWSATAPMQRNPHQPQNLDTGGRWYPTLLALSDSTVLAMCGHPAVRDMRHSNTDLELFHVHRGAWSFAVTEPDPVRRALEYNQRTDPLISDSGTFLWPELYPRLHLLPNGRVFIVRLAGSLPHTTTQVDSSWIWEPWTSRWFNVCQAPYDMYQPGALPTYSANYFYLDSSVLLPLMPPDYRARILLAGEQDAKIIDLGNRGQETTGTWESTSRRNLPALSGGHPENPTRHQCNTVLLADGQVLVVGGQDTYLLGNALSGDVLTTELYDPHSGRWATAASLNHPRNYHSVALLLPDARVWIAGSSPGNTRDLTMELFSPPYLSRGPRPIISAAPHTLYCPAEPPTFDIETPDAHFIQSVALVRCSSVTHGFSSDQRYVGLEITARSSSHLTVALPTEETVLPWGYYMLFILNNHGVPSVAKFVRVEQPLVYHYHGPIHGPQTTYAAPPRQDLSGWIVLAGAAGGPLVVMDIVTHHIHVLGPPGPETYRRSELLEEGVRSIREGLNIIKKAVSETLQKDVQEIAQDFQPKAEQREGRQKE